MECGRRRALDRGGETSPRVPVGGGVERCAQGVDHRGRQWNGYKPRRRQDLAAAGRWQLERAFAAICGWAERVHRADEIGRHYHWKARRAETACGTVK